MDGKCKRSSVGYHGNTSSSCPTPQVLIQGLQNLNRAVHQDLVAVEILPLNQWVAPSSVVLQDEGPKEDDVTEEEEAELKSGPSGAGSRKPTGRVVGIIKRNWRAFCGMLFLSQIKEVRHLSALSINTSIKSNPSEILHEYLSIWMHIPPCFGFSCDYLSSVVLVLC